MKRLLLSPFAQYGALIFVVVAVAILLFPGTVRNLLRADQFLPHATCYLRNPQIILLHVTSDLLIGLAYVSISCTLAYLVHKASEHIPFHWMFLAFGVFIISCGFTHFMEVWTVWQPVYWLAGYVKVITATASVVTAVALFPLVPRIFALIHAAVLSEERKVKLERTYQDLEASHRELAQQKRSLEEMNRELEVFSYSVAHDLRGPLRAISNFGSILQEEQSHKLDEQGRDYLRRIHQSAARMEHLISDLLEYSNVSRSTLVIEPLEVRSLLDLVLANLSTELKERNAVVRRTGNEQLKLQGYRTIVAQVLLNLLQNAIKFVPPDRQPEITIHTTDSEHYVRICVEDNGIGIAPEHQQRIFEVFERVEKDYPGTGIGLSIVQRAMKRLNGRVGVKSELGKGSAFWIDLPRA